MIVDSNPEDQDESKIQIEPLLGQFEAKSVQIIVFEPNLQVTPSILFTSFWLVFGMESRSVQGSHT